MAKKVVSEEFAFSQVYLISRDSFRPDKVAVQRGEKKRSLKKAKGKKSFFSSQSTHWQSSEWNLKTFIRGKIFIFVDSLSGNTFASL